MSMNVEQVRELQKSWFGTKDDQDKKLSESEPKKEVSSTESEVKDTASTDSNVTPDGEKANDDVPPKSDKTTGSDEPEDKKDKADVEDKDKKSTEDKKDPNPQDKSSEKKGSDSKDPKDKKKPTKREERDYAFLRLKNKTKAQIAERDKRIAELEAELKKRDGLEEKHFLKQDGTLDSASFVKSEFEKRDMKNELDQIKKMNESDQKRLIEEEDEIITQRCFGEGEEYNSYRNLLAKNGTIFETELDKADPEHVIKNYLGTLNEYPVVIRRLMTDLPLLSRLFRSKDPDALKYNIRVISDEILDEFHKARSQSPTSVKEEKETKVEETTGQTVDQTEQKIPVIGRQIKSNSNANGANVSLLRDWDSINRTIANKHKW